ncbi:MAG TPA: hypothetical protein VE035_17875 [Puia sp.]|nr:hypothetical protein [Puia sp.]
MDISESTSPPPAPPHQPGVPHPPHPLRTDLLAISVLLLICCIAYWPLVFHVFSLKNDALNYFLPVRFQISEAIYNHEYPFWSPYFNLGYALHGDTQSGAWNPIVQLISLFSGPYSLYTLQLETVLYIFLSGAGMYFLLRQLGIHIYAVIFGATAYMLCGFNSDSCQFLNWLSGAAFLPFVVLFYYRMLKEKKIWLSLSAGFFLYLMLVSAYPAQFITLLYLLLSIFIVFMIRQRKASGLPFGQSLSTALLRHIPFLLAFLLLSLPAILSYIQYLPLSERGSGASYADAMSNPIHPLLLFGWLTPLPIHTAPFAAITDGLERNTYFGIIPFLFTLAAYFIRTCDPRVRFAKIAALIFLVMSLGEFGGLRVIAYYILPLMNTFRHPAGLKIFTTFFSCVLAAWSFDIYIGDRSLDRKLRNVFSFCMVILAAFLLLSVTDAAGFARKLLDFFSKVNLHDFPAISASLKQLSDSFRFKETLFVNAAVQLLFLWFFYRYALVRKNYKATVRLSIVNCLFFTFLFLPSTVVKKDSAASIQKILDENIVHGYPLPSLGSSLADNSADGYRWFQEIGSLNMYNKKIGRVDYRISPCNLLSQNSFWFDTAYRNTILRHPLVYTPDTPHAPDSANAPDNSHSPDSFSVLSFSPNHFVFASKSVKPGFHVLLQNYYPLWKLTIDGMERPIVKADICFMGFEIPAGKHKVEFLYLDKPLVLALWLNVLLTLVILVILFYHGFSRSSLA